MESNQIECEKPDKRERWKDSKYEKKQNSVFIDLGGRPLEATENLASLGIALRPQKLNSVLLDSGAMTSTVDHLRRGAFLGEFVREFALAPSATSTSVSELSQDVDYTVSVFAYAGAQESRPVSGLITSKFYDQDVLLERQNSRTQPRPASSIFPPVSGKKLFHLSTLLIQPFSRVWRRSFQKIGRRCRK